VAFVANFIAVAGLAGVEILINLVFSKLPPSTITELRSGPLGSALVFISILFLIATLLFVISLTMA